MRRALVLLPPFLWLLLLVAAPVVILLGIAVSEGAPGVPPFTPAISLQDGWRGTAQNLLTLAQDGYYAAALLRSVLVAGVTATLCLLLAYPMALGIAAAGERWRVLLLALVLLPFCTGFLPRLGAWIGLLRDGGWVNGVLIALGVTTEPLPLLYSDGAMYLGMVHAYLPFAVLPLAATLLRRDMSVEEAAADLGASPWVVFRSVTLPLSLPGAAAAFLLVFIPAAGEFVIPELLGPPEALLVGRALWGEFFQNRDWPLAAALAVALLALLIVPIRVFQGLDEGGSRRGASPPARGPGERPGMSK
ncbi:ABC transporter permease [Paracraurococcus ruber]|uniref:Putrescine/spermidine ABC transporter permease n=1 Tax=Paracraurococcus ruber TaxID=77675 RepID=A0ABS1CRA1_9PROT|nr:ABC transporter permease subunit [Paracraurococcus ruber]MBK1656949.1 putrescine/spermidine ABC transporter permease [Paracraurococcus ruber]TDG34256.1 ABC transporter permease subunit [Paracraurococcus ruber]